MKKRIHTKNRTCPIINPNIPYEVQATFALAWKILFQHLQTPNIDITTLNILSPIMDQLTNAYAQIKSLELSLKGHTLKIKKKPPSLPPGALAQGGSEETIQLAKHQLSLL